MKSIKKVFGSIITIGLVAGIVFGATSAFFSDIETSTGNVLAAGDIDLQIDNEAWYNGERVTDSSWSLRDLTIEKFFNLLDLKPGDWEEDTISIHVGSNDAWVCANAQFTENSDNGITEPEDESDGVPGDNSDGTPDGDLAEELNFIFWHDDGDNVLEEGEEPFLGPGPASDVLGGGTFPLADSQSNIFFDNAVEPFRGGDTTYIGKAFCFGEFDFQNGQVAQDGNGETINPGGAQGPGFACDGVLVGNKSQTDRLVGDLSFYAVQTRNNDQFVCSDDLFPEATVGEPVGAALADYDGPSDCNFTVDPESDVETIAEALGLASDNDTVCVEDGTYDETVHITTPGLTLASVNGPTNTATIDGGVIVDAGDVTVTGFIVIPGNTEGSTSGFYLKEPADNAEISYNEIDASGVADARGIVNVIGTTLPGVWIHNNYIHGPGGSGTGIYINPHAGLWNIEYNDIDNFLAGIGQWNGADVMHNEFGHSIPASEAIGVDSTWEAVKGAVNFNNFLDDTEFNAYGAITGTIDAENNFFSSGEATQVNEGGSADIDSVPEAVVAYPHN